MLGRLLDMWVDRVWSLEIVEPRNLNVFTLETVLLKTVRGGGVDGLLPGVSCHYNQQVVEKRNEK